METDREIIERLGGPARVAELLNYDKHNGTQRVHNWLTRGIPSHVKVERPDLFMTGVKTSVHIKDRRKASRRANDKKAA